MLNFSLRGTKTKVVVEFLHVVACTNGGGGWDEQPASRAQWIKKMKKNHFQEFHKPNYKMVFHIICPLLALFAVELSLTMKRCEKKLV